MNNGEEVVSVTMIPQRYLGECWDRVEGYLKKGTDYSYGRFDVPSLKAEIENGFQQLWVAFVGENDIFCAFTTQVIVYPLKKNLSIVFLGSDEWSSKHRKERVMDACIKHAKDVGCRGVEITGRRGWERMLRPMGFKPSYIVVEKEV